MYSANPKIRGKSELQQTAFPRLVLRYPMRDLQHIGHEGKATELLTRGNTINLC